jgi:hypothetical protein
MIMLNQYDSQLLIGQISYKQKADIYNIYHGYDAAKKQCMAIKSFDKAHKAVHG